MAPLPMDASGAITANTHPFATLSNFVTTAEKKVNRALDTVTRLENKLERRGDGDTPTTGLQFWTMGFLLLLGAGTAGTIVWLYHPAKRASVGGVIADVFVFTGELVSLTAWGGGGSLKVVMKGKKRGDKVEEFAQISSEGGQEQHTFTSKAGAFTWIIGEVEDVDGPDGEVLAEIFEGDEVIADGRIDLKDLYKEGRLTKDMQEPIEIKIPVQGGTIDEVVINGKLAKGSNLHEALCYGKSIFMGVKRAGIFGIAAYGICAVCGVFGNFMVGGMFLFGGCTSQSIVALVGMVILAALVLPTLSAWGAADDVQYDLAKNKMFLARVSSQLKALVLIILGTAQIVMAVTGGTETCSPLFTTLGSASLINSIFFIIVFVKDEVGGDIMALVKPNCLLKGARQEPAQEKSDLRAVFEEYVHGAPGGVINVIGLDDRAIGQCPLGYGVVEDVFILRDRSTMQSRGMAFVRFRDIPCGMAAIKALNGTQLPRSDSHIPLSVLLAQGEAERLGMPGEALPTGGDTKLFVSGLGPATQEPELRTIFEPYGRINEIHVPGPHALYAFVRFADKEDALKAIREVNGRVTVEGSQRPLEVKVAESRAAKADRNSHYHQHHYAGGGYDPTTSSSGYGGPPPPLAPAAPASRGTSRPMFKAGMAADPASAAGLRLMAGAAASLPINGTSSPPPGRQDSPASNGVRGPSATQAPRTAGVWTEYFTMDDTPYYHNSRTNEVQWEMPAEFRNPINVHTAPQTKGPPGANVFVFSVPDAWTENDLRDHFSSFGNIVSAKVVVDKHTGLSRGYGFISYDNAQSAGRAVVLRWVAEMNGFVAANGRRIKVQIKKGEEGAAVQRPAGEGRPTRPY
ncbi:hypothetical protein FOZ62_027167 [Perkinsus olseni]|uniref:Uncharacterized protein n=1 Tax=Perkinsus olseni TaxID=32597 RepID=A0A7J6TJK5_PEROL|nr:hypothetical protein FOZ62_027167 [Perkinsus olseni]